MDIFFQDPSEVPLPPAEVRIRALRAEPRSDGQRVRVYLEVDPFQQKPNVDLKILSVEGQEVASTSIIESMVRKMELTMHLRGVKPGGLYTLNATLFYTQPEERENEIEEGEDQAPPQQKVTVIDRAETEFEIAGS